MKGNGRLWAHGFLALSMAFFLSATACAGPGRVVQRPFSDFLDAQTDIGGWYNADWSSSVMAVIDYANAMPGYIKQQNPQVDLDLGTTVGGTVKEQPISDELSLYTVESFTRNAFAALIWLDVENPYPNPPPLFPWEDLFGANNWDLILYGFPQPVAVGDCHLVWQFINARGAGIPELWSQWWLGPPYQLVKMHFQGVARGIIHPASGVVSEDTPGLMIINQLTVPQGKSGNLAGHDGWPVELIELHPIGQ